MATQPTTAPPATSALVPVGEQGVEFNLDAFPTAQYNRLIPTQTIRMPSDLFVPVVQIVQLSVDEADKDVYSSRDIPNGQKAPTARGLNKLATAGGVSFYDERRTDDGTNPDLIGVTVMASMLLPTGQRITAPGSKQIDLSAQTWATPAQRAKYKSFFYEHVATRARNRAIRALLSLKSSYTVAELARPFAVVSYAPNMNHPEVRARIIDAMAPSVTSRQRAAGSARLVRIAPFSIETRPVSSSCRNERLTDIVSSGLAIRQRPIWTSASASTNSPIASTSPVSSANGMNSLGEMRPRSGCSQRTSASKPITAERSSSVTFGW